MKKLKAIVTIGLITGLIVSTISVGALAQQGFKKNTLSKSEKVQLKKAVFEKDGQIYRYDEGNESISLLVDTLKEKYIPVLSPDKSKIAFAYSEPNMDKKCVEIGVLDIITNKETKISVDSYYTNRIMYLEWIDNNTIGVEGHINPSTSEFFIYDVNSKQISKKYLGNLFTILPDRQSVLYRGNKPHFSEKVAADILYIDDKEVYKSDEIDSSIGYPQISPNSTKIAFTEINGKSGRNKVVVADFNVTDKKISNILKIEIEEGTNGKLTFDDVDNVIIVNEKVTYKADVKEKKLKKSDTIKDEVYVKKIEEKHEKLDKALKRFFNDDNETNISTINSLNWSE